MLCVQGMRESLHEFCRDLHGGGSRAAVQKSKNLWLGVGLPG
jgi:hypothetical protein